MLQPPEHSKRKQPPTKKPPIPHSNYKPSAAKRTRKAFAQLIAVLTKEWPVRSLNLGVKSGTGVIEEVLWSQLHTLAAAVHLLAVQDVEASRVLVGMASRLQQQQPAVFQNLQVLLDVLGLEELCDFLRLMCSSSLNTQHQQHGSSSRTGNAAQRPSTGSSSCYNALTAGHQRPGSSCSNTSRAAAAGQGAAAAGGGGSGSSRSQRRMRAAGGVFEISRTGFADSAPSLQQLVGQQQQQQQQQQHQRHNSGGWGAYGSSSSPFDTSASSSSPAGGLKFAGLLPPGHILVKTAQALQQKQEFQAALAAAAANSTHGKQRAAVPPLQLPGQQQQGTTLLPEDVFDRVRLQGYHTLHPAAAAASGGGGQGGGAACQEQQQHAGSCCPSDRSGAYAETHAVQPCAAVGTAAGSLFFNTNTQQQQQPWRQQEAFFLSQFGGPPPAGGTRGNGPLQWSSTHHGVEGLQQRQQQQQQLLQFRAPPVSIEQLWKAGRAATTAAVLGAARLSVHESPGDAQSLLLAPGLVVVQQQRRQPLTMCQQQQSAVERAASGSGGLGSGSGGGGGGRSRLASRRGSSGSSGSRPNSARGPIVAVGGGAGAAAVTRPASPAVGFPAVGGVSTRPSSASTAATAGVPVLPLHKVGEFGGGGGIDSSRPNSGGSRPTSSSRLGQRQRPASGTSSARILEEC